MNEKNEIYKKIFAMHTIMTSLNDEDILMAWLVEGVPDGTETLDEVVDLYGYMDEAELKEEYKILSVLFAKLVRAATKDGIPGWIC